MKPFSSLKFFKENKKRTAVIFTIIMLAVAVVSFITSMVSSIIIEAFNANLKPFEHISIVTKLTDEIFIKDNIIEELNEFSEADEIYNAMFHNTSYNSLMGNTSVPICFIDDIEKLDRVRAVSGLTLSEGRLPQGDEYEIALHEKILKNKNLSIGDYIGSEVQEEEWLAGKYKIVGVLEGETLLGFGNKSITMEAYKNAGLSTDKPAALLIIPKEGQLDRLNERLDDISKKGVDIQNYNYIEKVLKKQLETLEPLLRTIIFVVAFVLSFSMGALIFIIYTGRSDEFGILYAMGYRKGFINKLVMKELAALSVASWILGYLMSFVVIYGINFFFLNSKGQSLYFFTSTGLINSLFIPVLLIICASFPILRKLSKWDPISVIERRD